MKEEKLIKRRNEVNEMSQLYGKQVNSSVTAVLIPSENSQFNGNTINSGELINRTHYQRHVN